MTSFVQEDPWLCNNSYNEHTAVFYNLALETSRSVAQISYCCHKTTVCNGDQLLNFSVAELVRSQSMFSTDPEVLQNCAGFTLCSSPGLAVCSNGFDTVHVVCTDLLYVVCIGLLSILNCESVIL